MTAFDRRGFAYFNRDVYDLYRAYAEATQLLFINAVVLGPGR